MGVKTLGEETKTFLLKSPKYSSYNGGRVKCSILNKNIKFDSQPLNTSLFFCLKTEFTVKIKIGFQQRKLLQIRGEFPS